MSMRIELNKLGNQFETYSQEVINNNKPEVIMIANINV